jgi:hypothetical protein
MYAKIDNLFVILKQLYTSRVLNAFFKYRKSTTKQCDESQNWTRTAMIAGTIVDRLESLLLLHEAATFFYTVQRITITKFVLLSKMIYHRPTSFQNTMLSGFSVASISKVREYVMLALPIN